MCVCVCVCVCFMIVRVPGKGKWRGLFARTRVRSLARPNNTVKTLSAFAEAPKPTRPVALSTLLPATVALSTLLPATSGELPLVSLSRPVVLTPAPESMVAVKLILTAMAPTGVFLPLLLLVLLRSPLLAWAELDRGMLVLPPRSLFECRSRKRSSVRFPIEWGMLPLNLLLLRLNNCSRLSVPIQLGIAPSNRIE